ncbi:MAG: capsular polysaccharide export protein, LipB/KpsS family [Paraglaciecola chathamensis]
MFNNKFLSSAINFFYNLYDLCIGFLRYYQENKEKMPVEFYGTNWRDKKELPVAVLFGFNPWKRQMISEYLKDEYRTAFVLGNASFRRLKAKFLEELPEDQEYCFIAWGTKLPKKVARFSKRNNISTHSIEDGFVRSIGSGMLHTRAGSLCIDRQGIYFNASKMSDLECMLNEFDFASNSELVDRASKCIELFKAARLTKYYDSSPFVKNKSSFRKDKYSILVVGQVEDDASIVFGKTKINNNVDLVLAAKKEHPDANIYYRPHPDYWSGNRKPKTSIKKLKGVCAIIPPEDSLYDLFDTVDHVYTMTSLVGFEALIYGLKVTTFGAPFYSNWGLTDDRVKIKRRNRKLTVEQLFSIAYLLYPRYIGLNSNEPSSFEQVSSYFLVESLKHENIFSLSENKLFSRVEGFEVFLSKPFQVLKYLSSTETFAAADSEKIYSIVGSAPALEDYSQISFLLSQTSNYDALVGYSNTCLNYLGSHKNKYANNSILLEEFFYSMSLAMKNSNGRVIDEIPNIIDVILLIPNSDKNFNRLVVNYIRCLSYNLQYDMIEEFLKRSFEIADSIADSVVHPAHYSLNDWVESKFKYSLNAGGYKSITQVLQQKPARSERNSSKRHELSLLTAHAYSNILDNKFTSFVDAKINRTITAVVVNDVDQAIISFNDFVSDFSDRLVDIFSPKGNGFRRKNEIIKIGDYFLRNNELNFVSIILGFFPETIFKNNNFEKFLCQKIMLQLGYYKKINKIDKIFLLLDSLPVGVKDDERILSFKARLYREIGLFEQAKIHYSKVAFLAKTLAKKVSVDAEISKINFCLETSKILNSVPQPKFPKGVVFLASQTCFNTLAMMTPSLVVLKKKGYAVINLTAGMTEHQSTGLKYLDDFSGAIPLNLSNSSLEFDWTVDWEAKRIEALGINFYQGFYESLSVSSRHYHVDINKPEIVKLLKGFILRADTCLNVCFNIFNQVVRKGMPVSIVSGNSHVTPYSVFRDFARSKDHPLLSFINCNVAYEAYFSNLGSKFANTMCVTDMTLFKNIRAPFMARKDQFDRWYDENQDNPIYLEKAKSLINVNRVGSSTNDKELELIHYIKEQKSKGVKIVCAFGKVPVDLNVPYDGGPAHTDMADWITNTVEICNGVEDILLLVKPHPHELRPEIALDLVESFHDLIDVPVAKNVLLLGHKDINGHALAPYLDLALLYNGSSAVELAAQGIPVMLTAYFGKHDYPVELNYPKSRDDYKDFILSLNYPVPELDVRKRAAFLLCYLGTEEISILNQYSLRQLTNDKIGVPRWRHQKINEFLTNGDPKMELIADRIVEKISA